MLDLMSRDRIVLQQLAAASCQPLPAQVATFPSLAPTLTSSLSRKKVTGSAAKRQPERTGQAGRGRQGGPAVAQGGQAGPARRRRDGSAGGGSKIGAGSARGLSQLGRALPG